jgi:hypothetical protein
MGFRPVCISTGPFHFCHGSQPFITVGGNESPTVALSRRQLRPALEDHEMTRLLLSATAAASLALSGCATDPVYDHAIAGTATGAVIGAGAGAVAGSILPGIGTGAGAVAGGILGGMIGAVVNGRQYYRDTQGYCYYVDRYGQPHYSYNVRC